jgi:hypothetical protein
MPPEIPRQSEDKTDISIESGRTVPEPKKRRCYALDELLAQCSRRRTQNRVEREWFTEKSRGSELI